MVERFKLAYIGAGSFRFSLGFFRNIVNAKTLLPMEVALCDIDPQSLDIMTRIFKQMVLKAAKKRKYSPDQILVSSTTDRREALANADFVYKSLSVGMQKAEWFDIYLPLKFGIPQNTGDTLGPGGLFRGLRTDHIAAGIAEDMHKLCPKASLLNYTNPQGSITMAARTRAPDVQFIGLCHEMFGGAAVLLYFFLVHKFKWGAVRVFPKSAWWEKIDFRYGGINHFAWLTEIEYKGKNYYDEFRADGKRLMRHKKLPFGFNFHLMERYGWYPYPGSRHVAEFLTDYYNYFNHRDSTPYWKFPVIRNVGSIDRSRHRHYEEFAQMASGQIPVPGPTKFGEFAMEMTLDWKHSEPNRYVVNIPNVHPDYPKIIPELPDDCIVEVPAYFNDQKILPIDTIHLAPEIAALVTPHAEQQRYVVNAGLGNSMDLAVKAMQHDPMANWIEDPDKLEYLTKLMLYYEQEWLPESWKDWIPTKQELMQHKWWVDAKDLVPENDAFMKVMFPPDERLRKKAFFWTNP
jgi:alpha-galactosidase